MVLVADWDETLTTAETTATYARLAARAAAAWGDTRRVQAVQDAWSALETQYFSRWGSVMQRLWGDLDSLLAAAEATGATALRAAPLLAFVCGLATFDTAAVNWCTTPLALAAGGESASAAAGAASSPVLSGIPVAYLEEAATSGLPSTVSATESEAGSPERAARQAIPPPELRPGAAECVRALLDLARDRAPGAASATQHVLSINWSQRYIGAALAHAVGLPACCFDGFAEASVAEAAGGSIGVWANDLKTSKAGESGVTTGEIDLRVSGGVDKLRLFEQLLQRTAMDGADDGTFSLYVGDSVTDLLPLLAAHVGIIMPRGSTRISERPGGPSPATAASKPSSLHKLASAVGVKIVPLAAAALEPLRSQIQAQLRRDKPASEPGAAHAYTWRPQDVDLPQFTFGSPAGRFESQFEMKLPLRGPTLPSGPGAAAAAPVLFEAGGWDEIAALLGLAAGCKR